MIISFTQGIISYPTTGPLQSFLSKTGEYVTFVADNGGTDIAFAHGNTNYLVSESVTTANAWGPLAPNTEYWLYWDINTTTAVRTYGFTTLAPLYTGSRPLVAVDGQHWFNSSTRKMNVAISGRWREVIRVFAAKVVNSTFTPLGSGFTQKPFAGTQAGLTDAQTVVGRIIADNVGRPVRRDDGRFFTAEDDFFLNGSPINAVRLESNILTGTAAANLARYQVVKFSAFNEVSPAEYNDVEDAAIAVVMQDGVMGETVSVCVQGHITNPDWSWDTVGAPLWVGTGGSLVTVDPHHVDPVLHQRARTPVARVVTQQSVIFDQGLGGRGERGEPGYAGSLATNTTIGVSRLTVPAVQPQDPVVVGDNDPRNSNARVPLAHNQAASTITTPTYGSLTGATLNLQLAQLEDAKVSKGGDTMTGMLVLADDPTSPMQAATKQYVDNRPIGATTLVELTDVTIISPTANQVLSYNAGSEIWEPRTIAGGGGAETYVVQFTTFNAHEFGSSAFDSRVTDWNAVEIQQATGIGLNTPSGYGSQILLPPTAAYRIDITAEFAPFDGAAWPDGATAFGTQIQNGFADANVAIISPDTQTHVLYTPSGSMATPPDGNESLRTVWPNAAVQMITDTYIVANRDEISDVAVQINAFAARSGAAIVPNPSVNVELTITIQRLDGNLIPQN